MLLRPLPPILLLPYFASQDRGPKKGTAHPTHPPSHDARKNTQGWYTTACRGFLIRGPKERARLANRRAATAAAAAANPRFRFKKDSAAHGGVLDGGAAAIAAAATGAALAFSPTVSAAAVVR